MITHKELLERLSYDRLTGVFLAKERDINDFKPARIVATWNTRYANKPAGTINSKGYRVIKINRKDYKAHRLAWFYHYKEWPKFEIDHINGDKTDNRIDNLRDVIHCENNQNERKARKVSSTGKLGIYPKEGRYGAKIVKEGKKKHLGYFKTPEQAHEAYLKAKRELHRTCTI